MTEIRRLQPGDVAQVSRLLEDALPEPPSAQQGGYPEFLGLSPDSLVAVHDEAVVGFIGVHPRRMQFDGATVSAACCSHLAVEPSSRAAGAGPRLLGAFLRGGHGLAYSDTASDVVARMWRILGGRVEPVRSLEWSIVLRPSGWVRQLGRRALRGRSDGISVAPVTAVPFHVVGRRRDPPPAAGGTGTSAPLDAAGLPALADECLDAVTLRRSWTEEESVRTLDALGRWSGGAEVVLRSVELRGRRVGWFAYRVRRGSGARMLQIAAAERFADTVFDAFLDDALVRGATFATGRLEPHLLEPVRRWRAVLGPSGGRAVVHARDARVDATLNTPSSQLSRLDGEWWTPPA